MGALTKIKSPQQSALDLVQTEFPNYHPLISLSRLAHRADVREDPRLELEVHRTILPYIQPKLSSIEMKVEQNEQRRVVISLFEEKTLENGSVVEQEIPLITDITDIVPLDGD